MHMNIYTRAFGDSRCNTLFNVKHLSELMELDDEKFVHTIFRLELVVRSQGAGTNLDMLCLEWVVFGLLGE